MDAKELYQLAYDFHYKRCDLNIAKKKYEEIISQFPASQEAHKANSQLRKIGAQESGETIEIEKKGISLSDGCGNGCLLIFVLLIIIISFNAICSDPSSDYTPRNRDDEVLTDDEYENKPYDELSEEEKKQAVKRIGKDLGIDDND